MSRLKFTDPPKVIINICLLSHMGESLMDPITLLVFKESGTVQGAFTLQLALPIVMLLAPVPC